MLKMDLWIVGLVLASTTIGLAQAKDFNPKDIVTEYVDDVGVCFLHAKSETKAVCSSEANSTDRCKTYQSQIDNAIKHHRALQVEIRNGGICASVQEASSKDEVSRLKAENEKLKKENADLVNKLTQCQGTLSAHNIDSIDTVKHIYEAGPHQNGSKIHPEDAGAAR
jgi:hypothetical protein